MLLKVDQGSPEWHAARARMITASTAAACLGLHPHDGPLTAWKRITGRSKDSPNRHTRWGLEFEPRAASSYEVETGGLCRETGFWVHDDYPWLGASPDRLVGQNGLAEMKCRQKLDESIPLYCRIQMIIQLECTNRSWCDYFCWCGDHSTFCQRIYRSPGAAGLIRKLEIFYQTYIVSDVAPARRKSKRKPCAKNPT